MEPAHVLIADDEAEIRGTYAELLSMAGHVVDTAADGDEVIEKVRANDYDMLLTDLRFPPTDGVTILREVKRIRPRMLVVIFTGHASVDSVVDSFRSGAFDFVPKPMAHDKLLELASRAAEVREMGEKRARLNEDLESERHKVMHLRQHLGADDPFHRIVGQSVLMQGIVQTIREVARTDSTVLLTGESGTGKGLVARAVHDASMRCAGPFVEANCVVYSEGVLHSELFGHERGAFTGAARTKKGRFELAQGGTIFLDEIGDISPTTQLLLLRVLQERAFERVGGEETLEADVRLIAATNRDLQEAIRQGSFRNDLYYRLNVIPINLPALRDHPDDIPLLAAHFVDSCCSRMGRDVLGFSDEAMDAMMRYTWPGNARELENMLERIVVLHRSGRVELRDLPSSVREAHTAVDLQGRPGTLQHMEKLRIVDALTETGGNKKLAAQRLGIHRSTLYAKLRRYGLDHDGSAEDETSLKARHVSESATGFATS